MSGSTVIEHQNRYAVAPMTGLEVYKIGREAIITLQPSTGYVSVSCPWHDELNGCHWWNSRGTDSLRKFLIGLERSYAMGKLFGHKNLEEFDLDASVNSLKREIIERRRQRDITEKEARDLWDRADGCDSAEDIANIHDEYGNTYYDHIRTVPKSCATWFWDFVWSAFIAHIKSKIAENDQAAP